MNQDPGSVAIDATELHIAFGDQIILDGVSLTIHESECVGLVGRNGAALLRFGKLSRV